MTASRSLRHGSHPVPLSICALIIVYSLCLAGCRRDRRLTEIVTSVPAATETATMIASDPAVATVLAQLPPTTTPTATATATATPFVCTPPEGWVAYTIQPNDTLFSLANKTNSTVADIKAANCKLDDILIVGDTLYLPSLPPPPAPVLPPAPPAAPSCSPFSCPDPELASLPIAAGGPNAGNPCLEDEEPPWISQWPGQFIPGEREIGERVYFFACEFPDISSLTATITGPQGTKRLPIGLSSSIPDYQGEKTVPFVVWYATCDLPTDTYTLTFADNQGNERHLSFELVESETQWILAVPQFGPPGTVFTVYYCGYSRGETPEIVIDFYYAAERLAAPGGGYDYTFEHSTSWLVSLNEDGWAVRPLLSLPGDSPRAYYLADRDEFLDGSDQIWLTPR